MKKFFVWFLLLCLLIKNNANLAIPTEDCCAEACYKIMGAPQEKLGSGDMYGLAACTATCRVAPPANPAFQACHK
jgi:hypothetical protein